jgi:hypothetical protein
MKKYFLKLVLPAILISSCKVVGTLYPLSENEKDFLFKKELVGKWGDAKSSDFYQIDTVSQTNGKSYRVMIVSHEKEKIDTAWFLVGLVKLGENYFIDSHIDIGHIFSDKEDDYNDWLITKHFFFRLNFTGPGKIEMAYPNPEELIKLIDEKKIRLDYSILKKDDYLILNKSKELQKGLTESTKYALLYKDKIVLNKVE